MTPAQEQSLVDIARDIWQCGYEKRTSDERVRLRTCVDSLLAQARADALAECEAACKQVADSHGTPHLQFGAVAMQCHDAIRKLGEPTAPPVRYCRICGAVAGECPPPGCG